MTGVLSKKKLIIQFVNKQYSAFCLNDKPELIVPEISIVPGIVYTGRTTTYTKVWSHPDKDHSLIFIKKDGKPHAAFWQTSAKNIKKSVCWGLEQQSITSKVIAVLGHYRAIAHKRINKRLISNTQTTKLSLLDVYQDRFKALQALESMVNKDNRSADYFKAIQTYKNKLNKIKQKLLPLKDKDLSNSGLEPQTIQWMIKNIDEDIERAKEFLKTTLFEPDMTPFNRPRGHLSILQFVELQMLFSTYELQAINTGMTFNIKRAFALTTGELGELIEDARAEIDANQADLRNAVTDKHHGKFSENKEQLCIYNLSIDKLSPEKERELYHTISYLEGWDEVIADEEGFSVSNGEDTETLQVIHATNWKLHYNFTAWFKNTAYYFFNMFKGLILPTTPWEEEAWEDPDFHLQATKLIAHAKPKLPFWDTPVQWIIMIGKAIADIFNVRVKDFGNHFSIELPDTLINDWKSCDDLPSLPEVLNESDDILAVIKQDEEERLKHCLEECGFQELNQPPPQSPKILAVADYELTVEEQNDILTALVRGLTEFGSVFSRMFARDPLSGLLFISSVAAGGVIIYLPAASASVLGASLVDLFCKFSYAMGSSKSAAFLAGAFSEAQLFTLLWDLLLRGPNGLLSEGLYELGKNPIKASAYLASAYGLGHVLTNGIAGHPIPWLSENLKKDFGTVPEIDEPFAGAKLGVGLYEAFATDKHQPNIYKEYPNLKEMIENLPEDLRDLSNQFIVAAWLSNNANRISRLDSAQLFQLSRQIDALFNKEQADSLKKILYPKSEHSMAYLFFAIPLSYIPSVCRFLVSPFLSLTAFALGKKYPLAPMKRAASDLWDQIAKDLSRLLVCAIHLVYVNYLFVSTITKAIVFSFILIASRIAALFGFNITQPLYTGVGYIHTFFRSLGEFLYPDKVLRSVAIANPVHTINEIEESYKKTMQQMGHDETIDNDDKGKQEVEISDSQEKPTYSNLYGSPDDSSDEEYVIIEQPVSQH